MLDKFITKTAEFGSDTKLNVAQCGKYDFQYWVIAPYFSSGYALLGEVDKVTSVSEAHFSDIVNSGDEVMMKVSLRVCSRRKYHAVTFYDVNNKMTLSS